jgi:hypothetical protein
VLDLPGGGEEAEGTYARAEYHAPLWEMFARPIFTRIRGYSPSRKG